MDNTPPEIQVVKQTATADGAEIQFRAEDATSPLRAAETATDASDWRDVLSDDGVVDSRVETFTVRVHNLGSGEHLVVFRVSDTAGNVGVGKAVIRVATGARSKN
jgi:flavin-binding protein dodecin